jgi:hypothetical protein
MKAKISAEIPFENWRVKGFWRSLWETWVLASCYPNSFFKAVGESENTVAALGFYVVVGVIGVVINFLIGLPFEGYNSVVHRLLQKKIAESAPLMGKWGPYLGLIPSFLTEMKWVSFFMSPVTLLVDLLISAVFLQIVLLIVKAAPKGFYATLRALAYGAAPNAVPYFGWLWASVISIIALSRAQGVPAWKTTLAYLLQVLLYFLIVGVPLMIIVWLVIRTYLNPLLHQFQVH